MSDRVWERKRKHIPDSGGPNPLSWSDSAQSFYLGLGALPGKPSPSRLETIINHFGMNKTKLL